MSKGLQDDLMKDELPAFMIKKLAMLTKTQGKPILEFLFSQRQVSMEVLANLKEKEDQKIAINNVMNNLFCTIFSRFSLKIVIFNMQ